MKEKLFKMRKLFIGLAVVCLMVGLVGCSQGDTSSTATDSKNTREVGDKLAKNQPTPTDIEYSLERYNLIKRAYWVNGMRDKANSLASPIADMPLGYVVLFTESGDVVGQFTIDGKVTSLNSYLTPDSEYYEKDTDFKSMNGENTTNVYDYSNKWLPDIDGSYGENDNGIFFFTTDGKYVEWTGTYIYSDIPFNVEATVLN